MECGEFQFVSIFLPITQGIWSCDRQNNTGAGFDLDQALLKE
jgi:hypothetical protein